MRYSYDLSHKDVLDNIRAPLIWQFNLAMNMALLSNDVSVVKNFFREDAYKLTDVNYIAADLKNMFLGKRYEGQAYVYFGICPMIVNGVQNLVASSGFCCEGKDKEVDAKLNLCIEKNHLQELFSQGVYYESGLGDLLFRICYEPSIAKRPIIEIIEPQHFEIKYKRGIPTTFIIKEICNEEPGLQLHEIYSKNKNGYVTVDHFLFKDKKYLVQKEDPEYYEQCLKALKIDKSLMKTTTLPFREFPLVYKQNHVQNMIYRGQRGVPDIQGLVSIEDALSESISDYIDAIRKGGVKEFVDDSLLETDEDGNVKNYDPFNKTIIKTKGSSIDNKGLLTVAQGDIKWQAYVEACKYLISTALNKAGISPTTIGITGLESINSSQESQDAREKPSLRKRKESLKSWKIALTELLNKYLQMCDYADKEEIGEYTNLIHIKFNEYVNPTPESITELLKSQVDAGFISRVDAIKTMDSSLTTEEAEEKLLAIVQEEQLLASNLPVLPNNTATTPENAGELPTTAQNAEIKPTVAKNEGEN